MDNQIFVMIQSSFEQLNTTVSVLSTKVDELIAFKAWVLGIAAATGVSGGFIGSIIGGVFKKKK